MDMSNATNFCAHCFNFVDESTLTPLSFNNHITIPITFRFCKTCFAKMRAGDEQVSNLMWERYAKVLPYEEERQQERLAKSIAEKNAANAANR